MQLALQEQQQNAAAVGSGSGGGSQNQSMWNFLNHMQVVTKETKPKGKMLGRSECHQCRQSLGTTRRSLALGQVVIIVFQLGFQMKEEATRDAT